MKVLKHKDWLFMQRSTLTYSIDHMVLDEGKRPSTIPHEGFNNKIRVEIPNN